MLILHIFHIKHHRNAEPCRIGIWGWQIVNTSKYLTKYGICCQPYIPTFIMLSRKKKKKTRLYTSSFWEISDVRKTISPHSLVFLWAFCHCAHITRTNLRRGQRQPVPFPRDSGSRCTPEAEDNTWKTVRYLCGDPSPAKMHLSTSFRQEETKRSSTPPKKPHGL